MASGGANDVNHLILVEDIRDLDLLFEEADRKVNLRLRGSAIDLNFFDVGFFLTNFHLTNLCVADCADHLAILLRAFDLGRHSSTILAGSLPAFLVLGKGLLL